jgi:hypothetical protein
VHDAVHRKGQLTSSCCMMRPLGCGKDIYCGVYSVVLARHRPLCGRQEQRSRPRLLLGGKSSFFPWANTDCVCGRFAINTRDVNCCSTPPDCIQSPTCQLHLQGDRNINR